MFDPDNVVIELELSVGANFQDFSILQGPRAWAEVCKSEKSKDDFPLN